MDDYVSVPDPVPPAIGSVGEEVYAALRPLADDDRNQGWTLLHICEAAGRMWQAVHDLTRYDDQGRPGWSALLDLERCPGQSDEIDGLPFLGQIAGVRRIAHLPDDERRAAIREREGYHRGRPAAIVSYAMRFTDGTPGAVVIRERYDPALGLGVDAPYHGRVRIKRSRLLPGLDEAEISARILARIPAGLIYDVEITDDLDWDDVRSTYTSWDDVLARTTSWDDLLRG